MFSYVLKRLSLLVLTLWIVLTVTFFLTNVVPGNVAVMILGTRSNPQTLAALEKELGLTEPLPVQYVRWLGRTVSGHWGKSLRFDQPITQLVGQKLVTSSMLVVLALLIALVASIPMGVVAARRQNRWEDTASSGAALIGISLPDFFWGILFILIFSKWLRLLPASGSVDPGQDFLASVKHALLPALALGVGLMAHLTRMTRSAMLETLSKDYVRVSRAKGLAERTVIYKHALRNAIGPVLTVAGLQLGYLFGGVIVVESLFNYTGLGWLTYQALLNRDIPLIQASVLVIAAIFMGINLVVDLLYRTLDPRIEYG
ncbi:MAG: ABC transporter permease [Deinococcales bacterium]|jgi:ABC-type dipeptide/oligopeptide/nickel transport system permease component